MDHEICYICGVKIGRGNRSEVGSREKMEKLVSVSNTVNHSSTIISDILSRILNQTVFGEESVCRICFNLINDIDYHLKEAQEKTDEITNKFLDKVKDPSQYEPSNLLEPRINAEDEIRKRKIRFGKLVTISRPGGNHSKHHIELSREDEDVSPSTQTKDYLSIRGHRKIGAVSEASFHKPGNVYSPKRGATNNIQLVPVSNSRSKSTKASAALESEIGASSADEREDMTASALAEKKRRLISRVLAPNKRSKQEEVRPDSEEEDPLYTDDMPTYDELTIDTEKERNEHETERESERRRRKERKKKKKNKEKERKMRVLQEERERREKEEIRREVLRLTDDDSEEEDAKENTSPKKTKEIRTVDLAQLGDLCWKTPEKEEKPTIQVVARKTIPTPAARKQMDFTPGQTFNIIPQNYSSDLAGNPEPIVVEEVIATTNSSNGIVFKQDQISLKVQDVSDNSDTELTPQYVPINSNVEFTVMQRESLPPPPTSQAYPPDSKPGGIPNIACPHCDKKFMRGYNMRVHIDRVHNKNKPWQCQFCEKAFATSSDLKQHMSSHGMGKTHKCGDCGRQFNNRDSAILHRKQHNNERTHVCMECGKGFYKSSCLTRHRRCHTGERPFQCDFCDRKFSQVTTLKHHRKVCKYVPAEVANVEISKVVFPEQKIEINPHRKLDIGF